MTYNQKRSVNFTSKQLAYLAAEAERIGITVSDLIRRIIDHYREKGYHENEPNKNNGV